MMAWVEAAIRPQHGALPKKLYLLKSFWQESVRELMDAVGMYAEDRELVTFVESVEEVVRLVEQDWNQRAAQAVL